MWLNAFVIAANMHIARADSCIGSPNIVEGSQHARSWRAISVWNPARDAVRAGSGCQRAAARKPRLYSRKAPVLQVVACPHNDSDGYGVHIAEKGPDKHRNPDLRGREACKFRAEPVPEPRFLHAVWPPARAAKRQFRQGRHQRPEQAWGQSTDGISSLSGAPLVHKPGA